MLKWFGVSLVVSTRKTPSNWIISPGRGEKKHYLKHHLLVSLARLFQENLDLKLVQHPHFDDFPNHQFGRVYQRLPYRIKQKSSLRHAKKKSTKGCQLLATHTHKHDSSWMMHSLDQLKRVDYPAIFSTRAKLKML